MSERGSRSTFGGCLDGPSLVSCEPFTHRGGDRRRPSFVVYVDDGVASADADLATTANLPGVRHRRVTDVLSVKRNLDLVLETENFEVLGFDCATREVMPLVEEAERAAERGLRCLGPTKGGCEVDAAAGVGVDPGDAAPLDVGRSSHDTRLRHRAQTKRRERRSG